MNLTVRYMAQLKAAAGNPMDRVELTRSQSVGQVLAGLSEQHGETFRQLLLTPDGNLQPTLLLFLGEDQITPDTVVPRRDSEVLTVLSPMAGG